MTPETFARYACTECTTSYRVEPLRQEGKFSRCHCGQRMWEKLPSSSAKKRGFVIVGIEPKDVPIAS